MSAPYTVNDMFANMSYDRFVEDVAVRVASAISRNQSDKEFISQRKEYAMFGRANVDRWRRKGMVKPCKRPGKVEYRTTDLRKCQNREQDYF